MSTQKQRERTINRVVRRLDDAWDALGELHDLVDECGGTVTHHDVEQRRFLRQRADWLRDSSWWKREG
jgi:hypothetical protein